MLSNPTPRPKRWIWFFALLAVATPAAIAVLMWYNLHQQLTPERLAQARARWNEVGPPSYVLDYAIKREYNPDPVQPPPEKYTVRVQDRRVEAVTGPDGRPPPPGEFEFGSMDDLFDRIGRQLRADRESGGPRPFVKADFDPGARQRPSDGHVIHYVRTVRQTGQRLEVTVTLHPLTASSP
jgi:hypothetical protein